MSEQAPSGVRPPAELRLAARPESVRRARRFLRELLVAGDRERWVDAAELAVSEVVTNGVLHAHSELVVRVRLLADQVEVEVADANPALPIQRRAQDADSTTGRGLELVTALTRACGVRPEPTGKVVWFTVGDDEPAVELSEAELLAAWDADEGWDADGDWGRSPQVPAQEQRVVLQRLPTALWFAAREHHQALLRELVLYLAEHDRPGVPALDLPLADEARSLIWSALLDEVDRHGGAPRQVDLELAVPPGLARAFGALQDALDAGERLAAADRLLVRPALPEVVAVRDWACEQVVAQLAGVPAAPWPGTDQPHFAEQASGGTPPAPDWDVTVVTGSELGVVAADDGNRILAISPSLAAALGWEPEQVLGRRVVALVPPELREAHVAGFSRHLSTGQSRLLGVPLELPVLRRDGSRVSCSFRLERAPTGGGRPVYLAWIQPLDA